jgi:hypothetical protein
MDLPLALASWLWLLGSGFLALALWLSPFGSGQNRLNKGNKLKKIEK